MSLSSALPPPINITWDNDDERKLLKGAPAIGALVSAKISAPPYGERKGWIPRVEADFGDGGAFPEITVVQYPLGEFYCSRMYNFIICTVFITIFLNILLLL